jgi:hypothetical protein
MGGWGPFPLAGGQMDQTQWFHVACQILDDQYAQDKPAIDAMRKDQS